MTWPLVPVASFCETSSGGTPSRNNSADYYDGDIPWVKSGELLDAELDSAEEKITKLALKESSAKLVPADSVLIAMYGATVGRTALLKIEAATNQAICSIVPSPELAISRYVWYALRASYNDLLAKRVGGAQPNINQQIIKQTRIPLPPPSEQHRIVELLDQADALRRLRRAADAKAGRILPALFLKMFGDPATNPMGWSVKPFDEAFRDTTAGNGKLQSKQFQESGAIAVVDQGQSQIAGYTDDESLVYKGELPAIIFGDHTRIFKFVDHPFVLGADGVRVLTPRKGFDPIFAYWHCQMLDIHSAGYSRHFKFLKEKPFIRPSEVLQKRFAEIADSLMTQLSTLDKAAREVEDLFSTLLHKALSGGLTAKWREAHMQELLAEMQQQARALNLPMPQEIAA